ncbi:ABC transporter permease [Metasolibacillus meyeri]|uniref:ABC transporter permease n=1 Tax=Metasolibacillus meyeri TaxID=1071052 RepID=A0AAW9NT96_9BACL|nr:ABC transporter permease [Metasolibacillus meyeri]MEC1178156.1 ABC transporter permease [Metasolibacillus meyeri]
MKIKNIWKPALVLLLAMVLWEMATKLFQVEIWVLPAPSIIAKEMFVVFPAFLPHILATIKLVLVGFTSAIVLGIIVATMLHIFPTAREIVMPFLVISQNIPTIVLAPLLMIWFGLGDFPKYLIIATTAFFPIAIATLDGFSQTNREYMHYMQMMGATRKQTFFKLQLPNAIPSIFSGIKIAATYSVMTAVVAEWLGAQKGIGVFMTLAASSYRTPRVFVAIVITIILSLIFFALFLALEKWFTRWQRNEGIQ